MTTIPADFEVQPIDPTANPGPHVTCGYCGLSWDDTIVTSMTPAPAARCPFEAFHVYPAELEQDGPQTITVRLLTHEDERFTRSSCAELLQEAHDAGYLPGASFLVTKIERGDADFWREWGAAQD